VLGGGDEISFTMCGDTIDHYSRSGLYSLVVWALCSPVPNSAALVECVMSATYMGCGAGSLWWRRVIVARIA
jgi:hypothetical protein